VLAFQGDPRALFGWQAYNMRETFISGEGIQPSLGAFGNQAKGPS